MAHGDESFASFVDRYRSKSERELIEARPILFHAFATCLQKGRSGEQVDAARCCWWLAEQGLASPESFCYRLLDIASQSHPVSKESGYQALSQCVPADHEGLFLVTNILQKDLRSGDPEPALVFIANSRTSAPLQICAIWEDVRALLTHSRPVVRKKAVAALSACLRLGCIRTEEVVEKLRDCLDDDHQGVVNATSGLICTLEASDCLMLLPRCAALLEKSTNVMLQSRLVTFIRKAAAVESRVGLRMESKLKDLVNGEYMKVVQLGAAMALTTLSPPLKDSLLPVCNLVERWLQLPDHNLKSCAVSLSTAIICSGLSMADLKSLLPNLETRMRLLMEDNVPALSSAVIILFIASLNFPDVLKLVSITSETSFHRAAKWNGILLCQAIERQPPGSAVLDELLNLIMKLTSNLSDRGLPALLRRLLKISAENPAHEQAILPLLIRLLPDRWLSNSSEEDLSNLSMQIFAFCGRRLKCIDEEGVRKLQVCSLKLLNLPNTVTTLDARWLARWILLLLDSTDNTIRGPLPKDKLGFLCVQSGQRDFVDTFPDCQNCRKHTEKELGAEQLFTSQQVCRIVADL